VDADVEAGAWPDADERVEGVAGALRAARRRPGCGRAATAVAALLALVAVVAPRPAFSESGAPGGWLGRMPPGSWVREARANAAAGRFFASDLTVHPTRADALHRSFVPVDAHANVAAALRGHVHPLALVGAVTFPIAVEVQRQIAAGEPLNFRRILSNLDARAIAGAALGSFGGGLVGAAGGAALQSALAGFGPAGAAVGLFARPVFDFMAATMGMEVGRELATTGSIRVAVAHSLTSIRPLRDVGQAVGGSIGAIVGQVLIPVPIVGGILGGMVGGIVGAAIGNALARAPVFADIDAAIRDRLTAAADWILGGRRGRARPEPGRPEARIASAEGRPAETAAAPPAPDPPAPEAPGDPAILGVTAGEAAMP
jgi:hypothetical protein